jgi:hypothetical protein
MTFFMGTDELIAEVGAGLSFPVVADDSGEVMARWDQDGATPSPTLLGPGLEILQLDRPLDLALMEEHLPAP